MDIFCCSHGDKESVSECSEILKFSLPDSDRELIEDMLLPVTREEI